MGYDDNTPLTGTTGGGLPAEIWRETMVAGRGRPAGPAAARARPRPPVARRPGGCPPRSPGVETAVRTVVQNVLQGLFGRN